MILRAKGPNHLEFTKGLFQFDHHSWHWPNAKTRDKINRRVLTDGFDRWLSVFSFTAEQKNNQKIID